MSGTHDNDRHKLYSENSFYHVYNRGINKQIIFHDDEDYRQLLGVIKRQQSAKPRINRHNNRSYANYLDEIDVVAFAIMPNHFHILLYQRSSDGIVRFMKALQTSYSKYYNKKYERVGPLFQGRYKAEKISEPSTAAIVSRYIHLNPKNWQFSPHTSIDYYSGNRRAEWVKPKAILDQFSSYMEYHAFLEKFDPKDNMNYFKF